MNIYCNDDNIDDNLYNNNNRLNHSPSFDSTRYYGEPRLYLFYDNNPFQNWYYIVNSNSGEIPEGKLNYQKSKIDSNKMASTMTWKI